VSTQPLEGAPGGPGRSRVLAPASAPPASSDVTPADVPPLLTGLVDDAAVFPPGNAPLPDAIAAHRVHRSAWYSALIGPLLLPVSDVDELGRWLGAGDGLRVALVGGLTELRRAVESAPPGMVLAHVESPVARRGEDPLPGLHALLASGLSGYAEVPLTWGLLAALDELASGYAGGGRLLPKFRTGGLAAELFPTPAELAAVICACRDRGLPFKLTAGLHRALRYSDPETGFSHHGFLNILAATIAADGGADPQQVIDVLAANDPVALVEVARGRLHQKRPLWIGFGTCDIAEPLEDLRRLGLMP
jgi:hypothetical protein